MQQLPALGGSTVSAEVYRDPARFELECEHVLRASWMIAARSSEIPNPNDWVLYEGHGETVIVSRQADGSVAAFHNVCQHRGSTLTGAATSGCDRRFSCPWHGWTYDTRGLVVGVPEREDFDPEHLDGLRSPAVAANEWGGWGWINLAGPDQAPALSEWLGADIVSDLGRFQMDDMVLLDKLVYDVPVYYKAIVDGFNEVYHVTALHHVPATFTKAARDTTFHLTGPDSMMFLPRPDRREQLQATGDHHRNGICHYVIFPNSVINNNPDQIQLFHPIPRGRPHSLHLPGTHLRAEQCRRSRLRPVRQQGSAALVAIANSCRRRPLCVRSAIKFTTEHGIPAKYLLQSRM